MRTPELALREETGLQPRWIEANQPPSSQLVPDVFTTGFEVITEDPGIRGAARGPDREMGGMSHIPL